MTLYLYYTFCTIWYSQAIQAVAAHIQGGEGCPCSCSTESTMPSDMCILTKHHRQPPMKPISPYAGHVTCQGPLRMRLADCHGDRFCCGYKLCKQRWPTWNLTPHTAYTRPLSAHFLYGC